MDVIYVDFSKAYRSIAVYYMRYEVYKSSSPKVGFKKKFKTYLTMFKKK